MTTAGRPFLAIVLAAGEGTRMRSARPKVLHEVAGRSMLGHVLACVGAAGASEVAVVVGPGRDDVAAEAHRAVPGARVFVQTERRGTAHAVLAARDALTGESDLLVLFGDTPLVTADTVSRLRAALNERCAIAVLGFEAADPTGYGRILIGDTGDVLAIREERDATEAERAIGLCNGGIMALRGTHALSLLDAVDNSNSKGEFYLTDVVALARAKGLAAGVVRADEEEVLGVNDRRQLAEAEAVIQKRLRHAAMRDGVTLQDPASTFFSFDTVLAPDVTVEPHVVFGPGVRVATGAVIHAFSHLASATVGEDASVGPYARLRPGTVLGARSKVGNFVETKTAQVGDGAKINHLSYVGDATVGATANIGAGTITCNYDGYAKHRTEIGAGAFIGSNTSLVAPVRVGAGAYVASGSVITADVEPDALAIARGRQVAKSGWAATLRLNRPAKK